MDCRNNIRDEASNNIEVVWIFNWSMGCTALKSHKGEINNIEVV